MLNRLQKTTWMDRVPEQYEFILPRDTEAARKYICQVASHHAFHALCDESKTSRLTKSQIEMGAEIACEKARDNTKAIQFTNDFDAFVELAVPVFTKAYEKTKDILFSKQSTFLSMRTEAEICGFDKAYLHISNDIEQYVKWGDRPVYSKSRAYAWWDE